MGLTVVIGLVTAFWWGSFFGQPIPETTGFADTIYDSRSHRHVFVAYRPSLGISLDGRNLVFVARQESTVWLFRRSMDTMKTFRLEGTEDAYGPFLSPDGEWIGFFADGRFKRVAMTGGPVFELCYAPKAVGGSWGSDGRIIFAGAVGGLWRVAVEGGPPEVLTTPQYRSR